MGRAKSIGRCAYYMQDDHTAVACPRNPSRPVFGWFPDLSAWFMHPLTLKGFYSAQKPQDICHRFSDSKYKKLKCKYRHTCTSFQGPQAYDMWPAPRDSLAATVFLSGSKTKAWLRSQSTKPMLLTNPTDKPKHYRSTLLSVS